MQKAPTWSAFHKLPMSVTTHQLILRPAGHTRQWIATGKEVSRAGSRIPSPYGPVSIRVRAR